MGKVIAKDLEAAGIDVSDGDGRVVDFHALRHTFITRMARSGVTPKVAQALARHSTITLTMDRYAHVALADTSRTLAALPSIPTADETPGEIEAQHVAATGTDGPIGAIGQADATDATRANVVAHGGDQKQRPEQRAGTTPGHSTPTPVTTPAGGSRNGTAATVGTATVCARQDPAERGLVPGESSEADGTRTRNHRIDRILARRHDWIPGGSPVDSHLLGSQRRLSKAYASRASIGRRCKRTHRCRRVARTR